jgi:predicted GIY-YIG superfamily endonuclease
VKIRQRGGAMKYVYILQSTGSEEHFYTGLTDDLRVRLKKHNAGEVLHTAKFKPWRIKTYLAFADEARAVAFKRYLKSPSGRAFNKKRL